VQVVALAVVVQLMQLLVQQGELLVLEILHPQAQAKVILEVFQHYLALLGLVAVAVHLLLEVMEQVRLVVQEVLVQHLLSQAHQ
jgi:hypothetical protein